MRDKEIATSCCRQNRHDPRRASAIGIRLDRSTRSRLAGQVIERAPVCGEGLGIETEAQGGRWWRGDVSRP
ncbi:hypothetical protein GGR37_002131 [Novosphingobium taihuense]|uniref:Uncharacterized protein n=1 Tax=Novosphingobium taihuense TaxID=260085 RepID=A0A7W7ABG5_9SPHN|nr:hypothetical protein [Novosphingobium taihuense]